MTAFLPELKRLKEAATKGPLTIEWFNADDAQRPNRFAGPVVVYSDTDCETHPVADFSCNHTCRDAETARANAALHAFLVNHADALAALVEGAEKMRCHGGSCQRAMEQSGMNEAIAKLNGAEK